MKREELMKKISEEVKKGRIVVIHPTASRKFKGAKVSTIDYPR